MQKAIKISLYVIGAIIALYILAIILAAILVKPKNISELINKNLYKSTGHTVKIAGKIKLSLFPWVGVRVSKLTVDNPKNFAAPKNMPYLAKIGEADIRISMWSLFFGKVNPKKVVLKDTTINLVKLGSGQANWQINGVQAPSKKIASDKTKTTSKPKTPTKTKTHATKSAIDWLPETIIIDNANLNYLNKKTNQLFELHKLSIRSDAVNPRRYAHFKLSFNLKSNQPVVNIDVNASFGGKLNFAAQNYNIQSLKLNAKLYTWHQKLTKPIDFALNTRASANLAQDWIKLPSLVISMANAKLKANLDISKISYRPIVKGEINIAPFNPRKLMAALGMPLKQADILNQFSLNSVIETKAGQIKINPFNLTLDNSKLNGQVEVITTNKHPKVQFKLALTQLNLDPYLKALATLSSHEKAAHTATKKTSNNHKPAKQTQQPAKSTSNTMIPVHLLQSVAWKGSMSAKEISYHGLSLQNISLTTQDNNNLVSIAPIQANIAKGKFEAALNINIKELSPVINVKLQGNNLPVANILSALEGSSFVSGSLNMQTDLSTRGNNQQTWMNKLNGHGKIDISHGTLHGLNIANFIELGNAFMRKKSKSTTSNATGDTPFTKAQASYSIQNGVVSNDDLIINASKLTAKGKGEVNLGNKSINYHLTASYADSNIQIPLILKGRLAKPKIELDVSALAGSTIKSTIKKNIHKIFNLFK